MQKKEWDHNKCCLQWFEPSNDKLHLQVHICYKGIQSKHSAPSGRNVLARSDRRVSQHMHRQIPSDTCISFLDDIAQCLLHVSKDKSDNMLIRALEHFNLSPNLNNGMFFITLSKWEHQTKYSESEHFANNFKHYLLSLTIFGYSFIKIRFPGTLLMQATSLGKKLQRISQCFLIGVCHSFSMNLCNIGLHSSWWKSLPNIDSCQPFMRTSTIGKVTCTVLISSWVKQHEHR